MRKVKYFCSRSKENVQTEFGLQDIPLGYDGFLLSGFHFSLKKRTKKKTPYKITKRPLEEEGSFCRYFLFSLQIHAHHSLHPTTPSHFCFFNMFSLSVLELIVPSLRFRKSHHSDSTWPFIGSLSDRRRSPRWKTHRKGSKDTKWLHIKCVTGITMNLRCDKRVGSHPLGEFYLA